MASELLHVGPDRPWLTWTKRCICMWREQQQHRRLCMFCRADLHIVFTLRGKTLENHQCVWIILTSCFCHHRKSLRLSSSSIINVTSEQSLTRRSLPSVSYVTVSELCLGVTDCTHTSKLNNHLLISTDSITERGNILWIKRCCVTLSGH